MLLLLYKLLNSTINSLSLLTNIESIVAISTIYFLYDMSWFKLTILSHNTFIFHWHTWWSNINWNRFINVENIECVTLKQIENNREQDLANRLNFVSSKGFVKKYFCWKYKSNFIFRKKKIEEINIRKYSLFYVPNANT